MGFDGNSLAAQTEDEHGVKEVVDGTRGLAISPVDSHRYDALHDRDEAEFASVPRPVSPLEPGDEGQNDQEYPPKPSTTDRNSSTKDNDTVVEYRSSPPDSEWPGSRKPDMWRPIWLSKTVLLVFAMCFLSMTIATGLLYHFSVRDDGLSAQSESNHYGWKYGPTACKQALYPHRLSGMSNFLQCWSLSALSGDKSTIQTRSRCHGRSYGQARPRCTRHCC